MVIGDRLFLFRYILNVYNFVCNVHILLDTSIWIEVLRGKSKVKAAQLTKIIAGRSKGIIVRSNIDCAIAITAIENQLILYHCDMDFKALSKHTVLKQKKLNLNVS